MSHSQAYIEFEKNISNLRRLSYGLRYLVEKKEEYIKWLTEKKGEKFPENVFKRELGDTINLEIEVSNILLRTYVEKFGYEKCGGFNVFIKQYKKEIDSHRVEYQRNLPPLPVLDINRELRNQSIHSEPTYILIISPKKPIQILSETVVRITNDVGEKETVLLHDLNKSMWKAEFEKASRKMSPTNAHFSFMTYSDLLRDEVLECIRRIDLI